MHSLAPPHQHLVIKPSMSLFLCGRTVLFQSGRTQSCLFGRQMDRRIVDKLVRAEFAASHHPSAKHTHARSCCSPLLPNMQQTCNPAEGAICNLLQRTCTEQRHAAQLCIRVLRKPKAAVHLAERAASSATRPDAHTSVSTSLRNTLVRGPSASCHVAAQPNQALPRLELFLWQTANRRTAAQLPETEPCR